MPAKLISAYTPGKRVKFTTNYIRYSFWGERHRPVVQMQGVILDQIPDGDGSIYRVKDDGGHIWFVYKEEFE